MKKIICLILALACSLAFVACGSSANIFEVIENSEPTRIRTQTLYTRTSTGRTYEGLYETVIDGEDFVFDYEYQQKAKPSADSTAENAVEVVSGTVIYEDGRFSTDGGETWFTEAPAVDYMQLKLNLTKKTVGKHTVSSDKSQLTATITAEQVEEIFGFKVSAETVDLTVTVVGQYLSGIRLAFAVADGTVVVETSYTYEYIPEEETPAE